MNNCYEGARTPGSETASLVALRMVPVPLDDLQNIRLWYHQGLILRQQYLVNMSTGIAYRHWNAPDGSRSWIVEQLAWQLGRIRAERFLSRKDLERAVSKYVVEDNLGYLGNLRSKETWAQIRSEKQSEMAL